MKFSFRYEALLSYRGHIKEKAEVELSKSREKLKAANGLLENYEDSIVSTGTAFASNIREKVTSDEIANYTDYISGLKILIEKQKQIIDGCEKEVREKMSDLLEKTKQYKIIEKLKEKDLESWKHQQLEIEQKILSETAVIRHGREFL